MSGAEEAKKQHSYFEFWRMLIFYLAIAAVFGFFLMRLFTLQVIDGPDYLEQADENRLTEVLTPTQRGIIYDRNGYVLARNVASYNVTITPALLPADEGAIQEIYRRLSVLIDVPVNRGDITDEQVVRTFKPCDNDLGIAQVVYIADTLAPYDPVRVKCNVDQTTAMKIQERGSDWAGVKVEIEPIREYPTGVLTSEIIGFLGPIPAREEEAYKAEGFVPGRDKVGYAGVEAELDDLLIGKNGRRLVEVDSAGQELRDVEEPLLPEPGRNVRLTIDTRLQQAAKTALVNELDYWNTKANKIISENGVVIAANPKTGEILALVSYPTFENNRMARLIPAYYYEQLNRDPNRPLFNHAVSAEHPPGSVFKLPTSIGVLNEKVVTPEFRIFDPGKITLENRYSPNDPGQSREYVCWERAGHGEVDWLHGIAWSCDMYFYKVSGGYQDEVPEGLNIWRMGEYMRALGYGTRTGIELPGEEDGLIPDPNWKRVNVGENWSTGDTYIAAMGQGYVLATPIQVLMSFNILVNEGRYMRPTLVREVLDSEGHVVKPFEPELKWDITKDPLITVYDENQFPTEQRKTVEPWIIDLAMQGMHMVTLEGGTADMIFADSTLQSGGKTGTAEYCDDVAQEKDLCKPGLWPAHAWYVGYAPYDDPEIVVLTFVYNGTEGSTVAGPVVRKVMETYFELKAIDAAKSGS